MRFRLLAFFPVAAGLALLIVFSASSFVSAVEQAVEESGRREQVAWISVDRLETECDVLYREIHALSHEITSCGEDPLCLGSPIFCPGALDSRIDREYERLRSELNTRCGVPLSLMDYAWGGPAWGEHTEDVLSAARRQSVESSSDSSLSPSTPNQCGAAHDWLESAASGESEATQYFF